MAKVNEEARKKYFERIAPFKKAVETLNDKEKRINAILRSEDAGGPYKRLALAEDNLASVAYSLAMNSLSLSLLGVKNENALNDARKVCYKAVIQLETVFTNLLDVPFSEYEASLRASASYPETQRYTLIRKTGFSIASVRDAFGDNSRWKWSILELEARLATVAKNALDLKHLVQGMDPRSEGYRERIEFFNLTRRALQSSADGYRLKYEVSTGRMDDFRVAIGYLGALQRLSLLLGRQNEAVALKRKIGIWKEKMESDHKNSEKASRDKRLRSEQPET
ncbi:MAG: hypothetical protein MI717_11035 [Spirochaetales bacterium]|nr:hypothetical protein [Spirochaetales bacterium]